MKVVLNLDSIKKGEICPVDVEGIHCVFQLVEVKRNEVKKKVRDLSHIAGRLKDHKAFSEGGVKYQRNVRDH